LLAVLFYIMPASHNLNLLVLHPATSFNMSAVKAPTLRSRKLHISAAAMS
jgi:hypothetical protein